MRHFLRYIALLLTLTFFIKCNNPVGEEKDAEQIASCIANNIDNNSIRLLKEYSYTRRGDYGFWQKLSVDTTLYSCSYNVNQDTVGLTISSPLNFVKDFPSTFNFDTSFYYEYTFLQLRDTIIRIVRVDNHGQDHNQDTLVLSNQLFPGQNPFFKFAGLTTLKDKMGFIGTSYRSDIGDFIEFWITPKYKLTYLPDTLNMNPTSKKYWLEDFAKGKKIKEHWSLLKVY